MNPQDPTREGRPDLIHGDDSGGVPERPPADPTGTTHRVVDIREIREYERNPRVVRNPLYLTLKKSIRARGLDQPLPITRRPGETHYITRAGGNTRLAILRELYTESGDPRFRDVDCVFKPWQSEADTMVAHLTENELRAELTFIERARALRELRGLLEAETGERLSQEDLSERLAADYGYRISPTQIACMAYALEVLWPVIPQALQGGLGRAKVEEVRRVEWALRLFLEQRGQGDEAIETAQRWFLDRLALGDCPDCWDFSLVQKDLADHLSALCGEPVHGVRRDIEARLRGRHTIEADRVTAERAAREGPTPGEREDGSSETHRAVQTGAPPSGTVQSSRAVSVAPPPQRPVPSEQATPMGPPPETQVGPPAVATPRPAASKPEKPSEAVRTLVPHGTEQAPGLEGLRERLRGLAVRLAEQSGLGDCIVSLARGIGFFVDLPGDRLVPTAVGSTEARTVRKRALLWWLLASLSEQFLHGLDDLEADLGETRLLRLLALEARDRLAALDQALGDLVGEPAIEALGPDLFACLDEAEYGALTQLIAARRALQTVCAQRGYTSPWEM